VRDITRRDWLKAAPAGLAAIALPSPATAGDRGTEAEFAFHYDHVIGTSLDLHVAAPNEAAAEAAGRAVLDEVERLRLVLSGYDSSSELSRLNRTREPVSISPELAAVLRAYEHWQRATGGALSGRLGDLARVWKQAEVEGQIPSARALEALANDLRSPDWHLDGGNTVTRITARPLDLNALGKAFIIDRAIEAARAADWAVTGLLLNLGGDIAAWGLPPGGGGWAVGIQSPFNSHDNAAPIGGLRLTNQAVAGSGGYQRYYTIGGQRYSHVLDPRTGRPAAGVAAATVVAADAVTANALATSLCVLSPADGLRLVRRVPGAECLIVAADGTPFRSPGLGLFEVSRLNSASVQAKADDKSGEPWPEGYQVLVSVELPKVEAKRYRRPYVAVWVEDDKGKAVRTLGVWGNAPKYLKDLSDWWKIGKGDSDLVKAVARATRGPGKYDLAWDGKDEKGKALPQGTYTVRIEVHREFGAHLRQSGKIDCLAAAASAKMEKNDETGETVVAYKKK
jgi:thiamine biosynthesis lipoprotein